MTLPPPLAIVQARMRSTRLPGKVMLPLADGRPILAWVVDAAVAAFGREQVVVATGPADANAPIVDWCAQHAIACVAWDDGDEADVLGRFWHVATRYRWHPDSLIVRVTADDPFKQPAALRRVAAGERLPVEVGGEAFTLEMLRAVHARLPAGFLTREHITFALFEAPPPPAPADGQVWTVDTADDYARAVERSATPPVRQTAGFGWGI